MVRRNFGALALVAALSTSTAAFADGPSVPAPAAPAAPADGPVTAFAIGGIGYALYAQPPGRTGLRIGGVERNEGDISLSGPKHELRYGTQINEPPFGGEPVWAEFRFTFGQAEGTSSGGATLGGPAALTFATGNAEMDEVSVRTDRSADGARAVSRVSLTNAAGETARIESRSFSPAGPNTNDSAATTPVEGGGFLINVVNTDGSGDGSASAFAAALDSDGLVLSATGDDLRGEARATRRSKLVERNVDLRLVYPARQLESGWIVSKVISPELRHRDLTVTRSTRIDLTSGLGRALRFDVLEQDEVRTHFAGLTYGYRAVKPLRESVFFAVDGGVGLGFLNAGTTENASTEVTGLGTGAATFATKRHHLNRVVPIARLEARLERTLGRWTLGAGVEGRLSQDSAALEREGGATPFSLDGGVAGITARQGSAKLVAVPTATLGVNLTLGYSF